MAKSSTATTFEGVCVLGLGHIGLPTAVVLASRGIEVFGVDTDAKRLAAISRGEAPIVEPGLGELLREAIAMGKFRACNRPVAADAFIVAVPTPLREDRVPDLSYARAAADSLAPVLKKGNLVLLESTSPVGTTESLCEWLAERRPDLSFPHNEGVSSDIRVAYCPERVLPGRVLVELTVNDRVIGGITPSCAAAARELFELFVEGVFHLTNARTAELVKLVENAYRDLNIAFANEMALVCDSHDIDPWELIALANRHPRVDILRPGPGVGGHCIPIDPWFIVHSQLEVTPLIRAARQVNDARPGWIVERVVAACEGLEEPVIACLGLAYKADVCDLRQSPSCAVVKRLQGLFNGQFLVVEPHISALPPELAENEGTDLVDLDTALTVAQVILLLTDHREFRCVHRDRLSGKVVIDTRGVWQRP